MQPATQREESEDESCTLPMPHVQVSALFRSFPLVSSKKRTAAALTRLPVAKRANHSLPYDDGGFYGSYDHVSGTHSDSDGGSDEAISSCSVARSIVAPANAAAIPWSKQPRGSRVKDHYNPSSVDLARHEAVCAPAWVGLSPPEWLEDVSNVHSFRFLKDTPRLVGLYCGRFCEYTGVSFLLYGRVTTAERMQHAEAYTAGAREFSIGSLPRPEAPRDFQAAYEAFLQVKSFYDVCGNERIRAFMVAAQTFLDDVRSSGHWDEPAQLRHLVRYLNDGLHNFITACVRNDGSMRRAAVAKLCVTYPSYMLLFMTRPA